MLTRVSIALILCLGAGNAQAAGMFTATEEASTHDAKCTKNERDAGKCTRDYNDLANDRRPMIVPNNGYYDRNHSYYGSDSYDNRRGYDHHRPNDRYDNRRDDHRSNDDRRADPNWKEKHDIRTEDEFERQRRKDQEYYDKY